MIITDDFVMLNFPKTGSSFAREVIKRCYSKRATAPRELLARVGLARPRLIELLHPKIDETQDYSVIDQHGTYRQIPAEHRKKPIVSITRNPMERYVSTYLFGWWKEHPPATADEIRGAFPNFPALSFGEYFEMLHGFGLRSRLGGIETRIGLGLHTVQFIQFYCREPRAVLARMDHDYIERARFGGDFSPVVFLHQENLNSEIKHFLGGFGFSAAELAFIDSIGRLNITEKSAGAFDYRDYYRGTAIAHQILKRDALLFSVFPEYLPAALSLLDAAKQEST